MKIAALASGGVDSSVALHLLKQQGHDITAFYLKIWLEDELAFLGDCPWEEDMAYVRQICDQLDIPMQVISMQREYWDNVVQYTIDEVQAGRTPNPDIFCNQRIKFGKFYDRIDDSFDYVATGHYARTEVRGETTYLTTATDTWKDQTYFLAHLSQAQVKRAMFPIGAHPKPEVRELAQRFALPNSQRKDSQGICFLGTIKFSEFIKHHLGEKTGEIVEFETGKKLGQHKGFWYHTIGQRRGLGLGGGPWYVVHKDISDNTVFVSRHYDKVAQRKDIVHVGGFNWISGFAPVQGEVYPLRVKVRHGENTYQAKVQFHNDQTATVKLDSEDQGLAPGQFVVFYQENVCLGCAVMLESEPPAIVG